MAEQIIPLGKDRPLSWKEGNLTVTRSASHSGPGCHDGCMVLLYTDESGKLVKVEGDPESPYNQGRLCPRCLALPQIVNHEQRLTYPMRRDPAKRGDADAWERITWDEAVEQITEKLFAVREKYGAESVIFCQGTGRDIASYITRLCWSFGSPNIGLLLSGASCYIPRIAASYNITGSFWICDCSQQHIDRYDNPEYHLTDVMIMWGNNPIVANADGFYGHWVVDMMRRGMQIIVVDPRVTWLASKSAIHIPLRPGTDAALCLGMLNVIINEGIYDHEFVENWCYGFEQLAERVQDYPASKVAEICWIPEELIVSAARMFAEAEAGAVQWGLALDMNNEEAFGATAGIIDLISITGNLDKPGGMIPPHFVVNMGFGWGVDLISQEMHQKRFGIQEYPLTGRGFQLFQPDIAIKAMNTGKPYPVKGAWLQTTNPLVCTCANPEEVKAGFMQNECNVVVDLFMTPTAQEIADFVLPAATYPERDGIRVCEGPQFGATINKVTQIGECKSDPEIAMLFGKRWRPEAWPWDDVDPMLASLAQNSFLKGIDWDTLQQNTPIYKTTEYYKYKNGTMREDGELGFSTRTGRIELYSLSFVECEIDPLAYYEEPKMSPVTRPELLGEFPLILSTGARDWASFHSEHRQPGRLRNLKKWPIVELNPATAAKYGVAEGEWVWIENPQGRAKRKVVVTPIVPEWMIMTDHGWWYPEGSEGDPANYGIWDININKLMLNQPGKSGFGTNYKALLCKIYPVKEGE